MADAKLAKSPEEQRRAATLSALKKLFGRLFGEKPDELDTGVPLIEMGADSLFLLQCSHAIQGEFGVRVPFRMMLEEVSTIEAVASYIVERLAPEEKVVEIVAHQPAVVAPFPEPVANQPEMAFEPSPMTFLQPASGELPYRAGDAGSIKEQEPAHQNSLERIMLQQLEVMSNLMSQQLNLLQQAGVSDGMRQPLEVEQPSPQPELRNDGSQLFAETCDAAIRHPKQIAECSQPALNEPQARERGNKIEPEPFIPFEPIRRKPAGSLTARQQQHLDELIARVCKRTQGSKQLAQTYRPVLADNRATAGFRPLWKEMQYPLVLHQASGSRIWDVDGNEYIDMTMGFGALLFGHSPAFVIEALQEQLSRGLQLGGESELAGKVAQLICELTGIERVTFCNSGTEAVMTALRLARAVTGRTKVALFDSSYHGTFDGVLVRGERGEDGSLRAVPLAPGIPASMVEDVLLLRYNSPESLDILKKHVHELAAVLIEPPRSRRPDVWPQAFLQELRRLTAEGGAALIFDEVVTGFRFHPGGAQAMLGIKADLVAYGKALGAGVPIAAVGGKAFFMDAIDGGMWTYGDSSYPQADTTYFAGTYFKHPLVMAAAWAALNHIKERKESLQEELALRTSRTVEALNDYLQQEQLPIEVVHYGSLFRFQYSRDLKYMDLFFYHMLEKGIYICETHNCLLSTAHTDDDMAQVITAVKQSLSEMREGGFLPFPGDNDAGKAGPSAPHKVKASGDLSTSSSAPGNGAKGVVSQTSGARQLPLTSAQKELWFLAQMDESASAAYNHSTILRIRGPLEIEAIRKAFQEISARHEALRATISEDGAHQRILPSVTIDIPLVNLSDRDHNRREAETAELLLRHAHRRFDLSRAPLFRVEIIKQEQDLHVLIITAHHIITDGWSFGVILSELSKLYSAECRGERLELPEPQQFGDYIQWQLNRERIDEREENEKYWLDQFADTMPVLDLPLDQLRPAAQTYNGRRVSSTIGQALYNDLKELGSQFGCTSFAVLLTTFKLLLHHLTKQEDIVVGFPAAGQPALGLHSLVGYCVNMLPLRSQIAGATKFTDCLRSERRLLLDAVDHQNFSLNQLVKKLNPQRTAAIQPLFSVAFNLDQMGQLPAFHGLEVAILPTPALFTQFDFGSQCNRGRRRAEADLALQH